MRRIIVVVFMIIGGMLVFCGGGYLLLMRIINTQVSHIILSVSGTVDEVRIYKQSEPDQAIFTVQTNGKDTTKEFDLYKAIDTSSLFTQSPPTAYYFVTQAGELRYTGSKICCSTGFRKDQIRLTIRSLNEWELNGK